MEKFFTERRMQNHPVVRRVAWLAWFTAALFYFYEYFVRVAPSVMEGELQRAFCIGASELGLATGLYYIAYGPLQLIIGPLFDRFGARRLFLIASLLVFLGCLLPLIPTQSILAFAFGRLLMGVGSAFAFIGTMYVATVWFPREKLAFLSGITTTLGMFGALIGQTPLARLIDLTGWKGLWLIAAMAGFTCFLVIYRLLPRTPGWEVKRQRAHFDSTPHVMGQFLAGLRTVAANRQTWMVGAIACALFMPLIAFADFWGVHFIQLLTGSSRTSASIANGMLYLGWLVGGPCMGALSDHFRRRKPFLIASCFSCSILLSLVLFLPAVSLPALAALLFFLGICSSPQVICFTAGVELNPVFAKGTAIALVNMIVMLLGGFMQPIVGLVMDMQRHGGVAGDSLHAFRVALSVLPISLLIAFLLSLFIRESYGQTIVVADHHHHA